MAARSLSIISLAHAAALHQRHQRWGLTPFQVQPPAQARVIRKQAALRRG
jgi:hypothetical protein